MTTIKMKEPMEFPNVRQQDAAYIYHLVLSLTSMVNLSHRDATEAALDYLKHNGNPTTYALVQAIRSVIKPIPKECGICEAELAQVDEGSCSALCPPCDEEDRIKHRAMKVEADRHDGIAKDW